MESRYCPYIGEKCEYYGNAMACATVSAVTCRERREKLLQEKPEGAKQ